MTSYIVRFNEIKEAYIKIILKPTFLLLPQKGDSRSLPNEGRPSLNMRVSFQPQHIQGAGDCAKENLLSKVLLPRHPYFLLHLQVERTTDSITYFEGAELLQRKMTFPIFYQFVLAPTGRCYTFASRKCREIRDPYFCRFQRRVCFWNHTALWHHGILLLFQI